MNDRLIVILHHQFFRLFTFYMTAFFALNQLQLTALEENGEIDQLEFHCSHDPNEFHKKESNDPSDDSNQPSNPTEFHACECDNNPERSNPSPSFDSFDLEKNIQGFILESKEIKIPDYPYAFNPSITVWHEKILMTFRIRDAKTRLTNKIGLIWLDEDFNLASHPYILELSTSSLPTLLKQQDPRLITIGDTLYIVYSDALPGILIPEVRRMFIAQVHFNETTFFTESPEGLFYFEDENERRWEKNWVPFEYQGNLLLAYSLNPHRIMRLLGKGKCETFAISYSNSINWNWGVLRGGTPALLDGDQYLAFFHSSISMTTKHSDGKEIQHYFIGAYTFSSEPPFKITQISPQPIIGKDFYSSLPYKTWKPLRVVFPGGFIMKGNDIWMVYGKQDFEIWASRLDKKELLQSLIPVSSQP
jgi:predicted GH43/DUF377 family glycosyl hydrolase